MTLSLTSSAFKDGARSPSRHTCEGTDTSPPLAWGGAPPGTRSFALICADPDAPVGTWYHWAVFNIPPSLTELREGLAPESRVATDAGAILQALNDFNRPGYGGPCPPKGHGNHHYRFRLMALDVPALDLPHSARCRDVERAASRHILAETVLTGIYSR